MAVVIHADPIRLLYVRDTLMVCGPGKTILNTWRTIDRTRFDLTIVATKPQTGARSLFLEAAHRLGAPAVPLHIGRGVDVAAVWRLVRLIKRHRIDVLQTHDMQTRRIGVIAAALTGVRHITSVHGWIFNDRKEQLAKRIDARLIRWADAVIAVSDRLKQELVAAGVPEEKITLLRNGILLDDYASVDEGAQLRREFRMRDDQPVVTIVGRLSLEKGHEVFLEAARTISAECPDARFLVVGDGPLEAGLKDRTRQLGLTEQVIFTGHRTDLAAIYGITSVLVIASFTEGIPNVLLEAFANAKPAVATSVGGVPEVLQHGHTGWLVSPGDPAAIADRVVALLKNPVARASMGAAGRRLIEDRFSFIHRTRALEELYTRRHAASR